MALALAPRFNRVTALDPSAKMVDVGMQPNDAKVPRIHYAVGNAEDLTSQLGESSVDLVVAGQAAHWFDHGRVWPELGRILRPGGTVAYVGYGEMVIPKYPNLNSLISAYQAGDDALGPHWSQPGRSIVEGLLDAVPYPIAPERTAITEALLAQLPDLESLSPTPPPHPIADAIAEPAPTSGSSGWDPTTAIRLKSGSTGDKWFLRRRWTSGPLEGYMRSASALHAYHEKHPEDLAKKGGKDGGDIVDRLVNQIREGLKKEGIDIDKEEVEFAWPLVMMMIKREA